MPIAIYPDPQWDHPCCNVKKIICSARVRNWPEADIERALRTRKCARHRSDYCARGFDECDPHLVLARRDFLGVVAVYWLTFWLLQLGWSRKNRSADWG